MSDEDEVFVVCPDYPDLFAVGSLGSLYSFRSKRVVSQTRNKSGYLCHATKIGGRNGKNVLIRTHVQVAKAFVPNYDRETRIEVNHLDGNKDNPRYDNLEWTTHQENMIHASETGLLKPVRGEDHPRAVFSNKDIIEIIRLSETMSQYAIAKMYGVSRSAIYHVLSRSRSS